MGLLAFHAMTFRRETINIKKHFHPEMFSFCFPTEYFTHGNFIQVYSFSTKYVHKHVTSYTCLFMLYLNGLSGATWSLSLLSAHQNPVCTPPLPTCTTLPVMQVTGNTECRYIICHSRLIIAQGCNWRFIQHKKERISSVHFWARSCILIAWKNISAYLQHEDLKLKSRSELHEF